MVEGASGIADEAVNVKEKKDNNIVHLHLGQVCFDAYSTL